MKTLLLFCFALVGASCVYGRELGRNPVVCAKGQSYWCQNITTAAECGAVKHCIQSVWEHERPIEVDRSEICQTCLDMVKMARDQLLSNQTEEEIKEVLEGTCKLMPIKIIREECVKLMDQFGPELVDTLASEMDPQVVCSVAGLCDNNRVHQIETDYNKQKNNGKIDCDGCNVVVFDVKRKLQEMNPEEFLNLLGKMCSRLGSYSDGCYNIALKEHVQGLKWLSKNLNARPVCNVAGLCRVQDKHLQPLGEQIIAVRVLSQPKEDLPCELCEQLVQHLKDIVVANTTESDFKLVLNGLCNQMGSYKDECLSLVNQYYDIIYQFLITELDGKVLCEEIKICPSGKISSDEFVRPLIKIDTEVEPEPFQLPITRYNPITYVPSSFLSNRDSNDQTLCSMCEFFLHFVQQQITLPSSEDKIKKVVEKGCARLPSSVADECKQFVETYMDEFIALLAQEIDPSLICPMLGVCPRGLVAVPYQDKPDCPLCLLAFQEIHTKLRHRNKTADIINDVVDDLCVRDEFPTALAMECVAFITHNRRAIVDMVLTEFTAQESCAYIDLCVPSEITHKPPPNNPAGDINTNEIKDNPDVEDPNTCVLCEFIMTKIDAMLKDKKTEEEIKNAVFHVCDIMPKSVTPKCRQFITEYADLVIELLAQEMEPKQVCAAMNLCPSAKALVQASMEKCLLCEVLMDALRTVISDPDVDDDINVQLRMACRHVPDRLFETCNFLVMELAPQIEVALRTLPVGPLVCRRIMTCENKSAMETRMVPSKTKCIRGSAYWCISSAHAAMCNAIDYCQREVWKGNKPRRGQLKGRVVVSY